MPKQSPVGSSFRLRVMQIVPNELVYSFVAAQTRLQASFDRTKAWTERSRMLIVVAIPKLASFLNSQLNAQCEETLSAEDSFADIESSSVEVRRDCELRNVNVLVVDDDKDCRELLAEYLSARGAIVESASNAIEGLSKLRASPPHVLISDIGMPNVDGYELVRRVRALKPSEGGITPAIALTAFSRVEDRQRALDAGFELHVAKPFDADSLIRKVLALVQSEEPSLNRRA